MKAEDFIYGFTNPSREYRPQYFWFLNHKINQLELERQISIMKNAGAGGAFLHARHGRITPYMKEEWLDLCTAAIAFGQKQNFQVWLYDEDGFPSGYAGGETIEPNPQDFSANFIELVEEFECESGEHQLITIPKLPEYAQLYAVVAVPIEEQELNSAIIGFPNQSLDLTEKVDKEMNQLEWDPPSEHQKWLVLVFSREWNTSAANLLNKDAMVRFISITHERYKKALLSKNLGNTLGTTIPGIFTDEPALMYCHGDKSFRRLVPFTPELESRFEKETNIPFRVALPCIFLELSPANPVFRLSYWNLIAELYQEAFFKPIHRWCSANHLGFMGHVANEGNFFNQVRDQVDFFKGAQYMHFGCCDQLGASFRAEFEKNYSLALVDNMVAPRLASSAARIYHLPRTNSECFGSSGWQLTLEQQKTLIDWQIANGVNLFYPHSFNYSIEGHRKGDHPPAFNYCAYFERINLLNDYIGRLCYLFSLPVAPGFPRVGIIYGNQTILASMNPSMAQDAYDAHEALPYLVDLLQRLHIDFDIIPESYIKDLSIDSQYLRDKNNIYDLIIAPALNVLSIHCMEKLWAFYDAGGTVVFIQKLPIFVVDQLELNNAFTQKLFTALHLKRDAYDLAMKNHEFIAHSEKIIGNIGLNSGKLYFIQAPKQPLFQNHLWNDIKPLLWQSHVFVHRVQNPRGEENGELVIRCHVVPSPSPFLLVFVANVSNQSQSDQTLHIHWRVNEISWERPVVFYLNPLNGMINPCGLEQWCINPQETDSLQIFWSFQSSESAVFLICDPSSDLAKLREGGTALHVDSIPFTKNLEILQQVSVETCQVVMKHANILNLNQWAISFSSQANGERPSYIQRKLCHEISFLIEEVPQVLHVIIDSLSEISPRSTELRINEKVVKMNSHGNLLDPYMWETDNISSLLHSGRNLLQISIFGQLSSKILALTDPIRLLGTFIAHSSDNVWHISQWQQPFQPKYSDLRKAGYPHYIWALEYHFKLSIPELTDQPYFLEIPKDGSPLCDMMINGVVQEPVWFGSYCRTLHNLKAGDNDVRIVYYPYPTNLFEGPGVALGFQGLFTLKTLKSNFQSSNIQRKSH